MLPMCLCPRHNDRRNHRPGKPWSALVLAAMLLAATAFGAAAQERLSQATAALFGAVELNDMAAVENSLADGADVEAKNPAGKTALDIAVDMGHFRIAHFLLAYRNGNGAKKKTKLAKNGKKSKKRSPTTKSPGGGTFDPSVTAVPRRKPSPPDEASPDEPMPESSDEVAEVPSTMPETGPEVALPPGIEEIGAAPGTRAPETMPAKPAPPIPPAEEPGLLAKVTDWLTPSFLFGDDDKPAAEAKAKKPEKKLLSPWARYQTKQADSPAGRTMDRVTGMVGAEPPAEDEHGLPVRSQPTEADPAAPEDIQEIGVEAPAEVPAESEAVVEIPAESETVLEVPAEGEVSLEGEAVVEVPAEAESLEQELPLPGIEPVIEPVPGSSPEPIETAEQPAALPTPQPGAPGRVGQPLQRPPSLQPDDPEKPRMSERTRKRLARLKRRITSDPGALTTAPETGQPPPVDTGQDLPTLPSSPQEIAVPDPPSGPTVSMQERLDRLGRTVDRRLTRDPQAILRESRERAKTAGADARSQITEIVRPGKKPPPPAAAEPYPMTRLPPQRDLRYGPPRIATEQEERTATPRRDPTERFLDRVYTLGQHTAPEEDIHGLPVKPPPPPPRPIARPVQQKRLPDDVRQEKKLLIDRVAGFFRHDEPGRRRAGTGKKIETADVPPLVVDTLQEEKDLARGDVVDDRLLDLKGVEYQPAKTRQGASAAPDNAFLDKLARVLSPPGVAPQPGITPPEAGAAPLAGLDLAPDQILPDAPQQAAGDLKIPDPWTMTIEQAGSGGGESKTLAVQSISPTDGSIAEKSPGVVAGMIDKVKEMFDKGPRGRDTETALKLDDEERLATAERLLSEALRAERPPGALPDQSDWPVTQVRAAQVVPEKPRRGVPGVLTQAAMSGVTFMLGESVTLENTLPPVQDGLDPKNECIKKNRATTLFCIEPIDWPDAIRNTFIVPTILYTGPMAIVRYDQGLASRFHALYPSDQFDQVTDYYQRQFGEPTEIWKRSIAPLAQPRQDNPTVTWRSRDPETNAVSVLEVRKFDDSRGGFPDTKRGAVMLYYLNAPPIFPQVSSHELMRLRKTR